MGGNHKRSCLEGYSSEVAMIHCDSVWLWLDGVSPTTICFVPEGTLSPHPGEAELCLLCYWIHVGLTVHDLELIFLLTVGSL